MSAFFLSFYSPCSTQLAVVAVLVFAGDVIPLLASVSPEWISAYDLAPTLSYDAKLRILSEAAECHQRIIFCHDAYTLSSRVKQTASGLYVIERDSLIRR